MPLVETKLNPIDAVKQEIAALIRANSFFDNIDVLTDEKGDIDTTILIALQKVGVGIVIEVDRGSVISPNVGSSDVELTCVISIVENVLINRDPENVSASGKRATDLVCELMAMFNPMHKAVPMTVTPFELQNNTGGVITWQMTAKVYAGWKQKVTGATP